jgi:protein-tyrosine phosphatase
MTRPGDRLPFRAVTNFRDIGGYPSRLGGQIRRGVLFRSDGLQDLAGADLELYRSLGIVVAFDLRRDSEAARRPNPVPTTRLCMMEAVERAGGSTPKRSEVVTTLDGETMMRDGYRAMVSHSAETIARVIGEVGRGTHPAVFHCHGGKDRTGVVAAVILDLLGVDRTSVLDDYELTSRYRHFEDQISSFNELRATGLADEAAMAVLGTPRWAMAEALELVDEMGGSFAYLREQGGLDTETLGRFTELMLDR